MWMNHGLLNSTQPLVLRFFRPSRLFLVLLPILWLTLAPPSHVSSSPVLELFMATVIALQKGHHFSFYQ